MFYRQLLQARKCQSAFFSELVSNMVSGYTFGNDQLLSEAEGFRLLKSTCQYCVFYDIFCKRERKKEMQGKARERMEGGTEKSGCVLYKH